MKKITILVVVLVLVALVITVGVLLSSCPLAVSAGGEVTYRVDIGDVASETGHNLVGWGPIEPAAHEPYSDLLDADEQARVIWGPEDYNGVDVGDTSRSATLTLGRYTEDCRVKEIRIRHLDGITHDGDMADDSFDVYVMDVDSNYVKVFEYQATGLEQWLVTSVEIQNDIYGNELRLEPYGSIEVKLEATGAQWSSWSCSLGQVAFDWIELVCTLPE